VDVLVDRPGAGRSYREAPEIDGIVSIGPESHRIGAPGEFLKVRITDAVGVDLEAEPV
jgi:hypothetical protein